MSEPTSGNEKSLASATVEKKELPARTGHLAVLTGKLLEEADAIVYGIVGICFVLGALLALIYTFWSFGTSLNNTINYQPPAATASPASTASESPNISGTETTSTITVTDKRAGMFASTIISLVSDLLLVLIIMEVLGTVIEYLKAHSTSLTPFLAIGIISATRGILSIGARLSVQEEAGQQFNNSMIELGVNAFAILALGITLALLSRSADSHPASQEANS